MGGEENTERREALGVFMTTTNHREKGRKLKVPRQNRSLYDYYQVKERRKRGGSENHKREPLEKTGRPGAPTVFLAVFSTTHFVWFDTNSLSQT